MEQLASWCQKFITDESSRQDVSLHIISAGHHAIRPLIAAICAEQQRAALLLHAGLYPLALQQQKMTMTVKNAAQLIQTVYAHAQEQQEKELIAVSFQDILENGSVNEVWAAALVLYEVKGNFIPDSANWICLSFPRMFSNHGPQNIQEMHAFGLLTDLILEDVANDEVALRLHKHARSLKMTPQDSERKIVKTSYKWFTISR
jgi:hypothetical protein